MKVWSTSTSDKYFSKAIIERDKVCQRCGIDSGLTCSHYWRRGHSATRFDYDNCIALCMPCHMTWEHQKNVEYRKFMINWLGKKRYDALELRARSFMKRSDAVVRFQQKLSTSSFDTL